MANPAVGAAPLSAIPKAPLAPTTTSSTYGQPPVSQRGGIMQMAATPAPGAYGGASPSQAPPARPSMSVVPSTVVDLSAVGEETSITEMIAFPPGGQPAPRNDEPRPVLIEDIPTMARAQPFELTGAVDAQRPSGATATPLPSSVTAAAVTPIASRAASSIPAPRDALPTPPTSLVPAMRVSNLANYTNYKRPQDYDRMVEGLRLAGLPE